jgi:hypothetical protein
MEPKPQGAAIRVKEPASAGTFAHTALVSVMNDIACLTFVQVFSVDPGKGEARAQVAAQVYMTIDSLRELSGQLGQILSGTGPGEPQEAKANERTSESQ